MRGLIIDYIRKGLAEKRGGLFEITSLRDQQVESPAWQDQIVKVGEALEKLTAVDPAVAEVVDLKFFCGFEGGPRRRRTMQIVVPKDIPQQ